MTDVCKTSWETRVLAGEPSATIRVDNISTLYKGPDDAWGRPRRPQPLSVSLEIFLAKPFDKTSAEDAVESDTVHYGQLSKSVQSKLEELKEIVGNTLFRTLETLWGDLTGVPLSGMTMLLPPIDPFLKNGTFKYLTVTMSLPKASAVGDGVSITRSGCMGDLPGRRPFSVLKATSSVLRIHGLRVPTLIGINANERERKQTLIANVEIENWLYWTDEYCAIEAVVTKVCCLWHGFALPTAVSQGLTFPRSWKIHRLAPWRRCSTP
jgi:dihydroneopterin aldolase